MGSRGAQAPCREIYDNFLLQRKLHTSGSLGWAAAATSSSSVMQCGPRKCAEYNAKRTKFNKTGTVGVMHR